MIWTLIALVLAGLQTTVWPLLLGSVASPQLWLNLILYFIVFRPMMRALVIAYALACLWASFTSVPLGIFWASLLILVPAASYLRSRTFWPGIRYFMIGSLVLTFGWHFVSFTLSQLVEKNPASLHFFTRFTEIVLTPLAAVPQYHLMQWLERWVQDEVAVPITAVDE